MFNYILAAISFVLGGFITLYSLAAAGRELSLGLMFGVLLLANGALRVWAAFDDPNRRHPE